MTPKRFKTRTVSRERSGTYLKKAREFFRASGLLQQHIKDDQLGSKIQTLSKVLSYKNLSAYEDREVTEAEGRDAEKLARRFLEWAQSRLV